MRGPLQVYLDLEKLVVSVRKTERWYWGRAHLGARHLNFVLIQHPAASEANYAEIIACPRPWDPLSCSPGRISGLGYITMRDIWRSTGKDQGFCSDPPLYGRLPSRRVGRCWMVARGFARVWPS